MNIHVKFPAWKQTPYPWYDQNWEKAHNRDFKFHVNAVIISSLHKAVRYIWAFKKTFLISAASCWAADPSPERKWCHGERADCNPIVFTFDVLLKVCFWRPASNERVSRHETRGGSWHQSGREKLRKHSFLYNNFTMKRNWSMSRGPGSLKEKWNPPRNEFYSSSALGVCTWPQNFVMDLQLCWCPQFTCGHVVLVHCVLLIRLCWNLWLKLSPIPAE